MGNLSIGERDLSDFADQELAEWILYNDDGDYRVRQKTLGIWIEILRAFDESDTPVTVRQMFYALVSRAAIRKLESEYNKVSYHLLQMRRKGIIPYDFIADNTRWMRKPKTYESVEKFLETSQDAYRKMLWLDQDAYVEIWCEKDALAGVIYRITSEWDVPLMVTRGFPSETFVYEAAEAIKSQTKPAYLYYFGDHDPSGKAIPENTEEKLRQFGAEFSFTQVAIQEWQIHEWNLPTRPTKKSDSRSKNWNGGSVELDALPAATLRKLVEDSITQHIDQDVLKRNEKIEELEKESLQKFIEGYDDFKISG